MDEKFKQKILKDFGLTTMSSAEQERMIEKIGNLLFEGVVGRAVDSLSESKMKDFEKLVNEAGEDYNQIISFLKVEALDFENIVAEEMGRLKKTTSGIFA
jgi:hypothetical protein